MSECTTPIAFQVPPNQPQLRSKFPKASAAKIRSALISTGTPVLGPNGLTRNLIYGPAAYRKLKKTR